MKKDKILGIIFLSFMGLAAVTNVIVLFLPESKTIVDQPEYDHKVRTQNVEVIMVFNYNEDTIKCIWIEDKLFLPATKEDYENL